MEKQIINLATITAEELDKTIVPILAMTRPLVRLKGKKELYRLWFTESNGINSICLAPEKTKSRSFGGYWSCSYYSPDDYGKKFEIVEIIRK